MQRPEPPAGRRSFPGAATLFLLAVALSPGPGCTRRSAAGPVPFDQHPQGLWYDTRFDPRVPLLTEEEREAFLKLGAAGYVEGIYAPPEETGVVEWVEGATEDGVNLYCSGHEAGAWLMDMEGRRLHHWSYPRERLPEGPDPEEALQACWRRVRLLPDGSLLAIYEGLGLVKVDRDSSLVWFRANHAHHDLHLTPDGRLFVLARETRLEPKVSPTTPLVDDYILELDPEDGDELRRVSITRALLESRWAQRIRELAAAGGDVVHANSIEILAEEPRIDQPAFQAGRALVCLRNLDSIVVIDLEHECVEWLRRGPWVAPHAPTILPDGRILVFDNMGNEGYSRILACDPNASEPDVLFAGNPPDTFFSIFSGAVQRLPRGNLLITESCKGRVFEVTPEGDTVWTFLSPHRAGDDDELVAVTFELRRVPISALGWLDGVAGH